MRTKKPFIPAKRQKTIRQQIHSILGGQTLSAKEISAHVSVSEKEVYEHLDHIQKTVNKSGFTLIITPAECRKCGFVFRKREKMKKPGKCPVCRGELIKEPLFSIE
ncbi:MAG: transcriptional regulator [Thermodesulfovibrionia bacterium]|nr:transcriptional regulator [Thermodesulfovibrionia bacterium]